MTAGYVRDYQREQPRNREYRQEHPDKVIAWRQSDYMKHRDARRASQKEYAAQQRKKVFDHYGWQCVCCGSGENLTIDHVNGDGYEHRLEMGGGRGRPSGSRLYRWLIKHDFPAEFQTMCRPCNRSKLKGTRCVLLHTPGTVV